MANKKQDKKAGAVGSGDAADRNMAENKDWRPDFGLYAFLISSAVFLIMTAVLFEVRNVANQIDFTQDQIMRDWMECKVVISEQQAISPFCYTYVDGYKMYGINEDGVSIKACLANQS